MVIGHILGLGGSPVKFTSKSAADAAGLHQRTVIKWSEEGFVVPSAPRRKYEPRIYSETDVVALMIAKAALQFDFLRDEVAEMVKVAQSEDEEKQKNARLIAVEGIEQHAGFVLQMWVPDIASPNIDKIDKAVIENETPIRETSLHAVIEGIRAYLRVKCEREGIVGTEVEAE
jgi:DNA-binding transcriptional MerR regulator